MIEKYEQTPLVVYFLIFEKDIQWSDVGVKASNKFLQKIWNLNYQISIREDKKNDKTLVAKFNSKLYQ